MYISENRPRQIVYNSMSQLINMNVSKSENKVKFCTYEFICFYGSASLPFFQFNNDCPARYVVVLFINNIKKLRVFFKGPAHNKESE